jgi:aspartate/methionine/tyrosine aminotransferase
MQYKSAVPQLSTQRFFSPAPIFAELQAHVRRMQQSGKSVIPLHIGDTVLPSPQALECSVHAKSALTPYGPPAGIPQLRRAIVKHTERTSGARWCEENEVLVAGGGTHALYCTARVLLAEGDAAIVLSPSWPLAAGIFGLVGAVSHDVLSPGYADDAGVDALKVRLQQASDDIASRRKQGSLKAIYLSSPNNPDGYIWSRAELEAIGEFAARHDLWIFSDEVYGEIVFDDARWLSMGSLTSWRSRLVVIGSLSKNLAMAGLRIGYALAPKEVVEAARRVATYTTFALPMAIADTATCAFEGADEFVRKSLADYTEKRVLAFTMLNEAGIRFRAYAGATYCFLDLRRECEKIRATTATATATAKPLEKPIMKLLGQAVEEGVLLAPGGAFGAGFEDWTRLCFTAATKEDLARGIDALVRAIQHCGAVP